jgi:hypothetical protein
MTLSHQAGTLGGSFLLRTVGTSFRYELLPSTKNSIDNFEAPGFRQPVSPLWVIALGTSRRDKYVIHVK